MPSPRWLLFAAAIAVAAAGAGAGAAFVIALLRARRPSAYARTLDSRGALAGVPDRLSQ